MAPKSKKAQKVNLNDFLADTSTGISWADEMDELPTAPAPRDPNEPSQTGLGGSHLTRNEGNRYGDRDGGNRRGGDRDGYDRPSRVEVPIPDKAPFNAYVGNLSWETGSTELEQFFGAANIISIRLINDNATGKPKGYGYVEFDTRDALVAALDKSGRDVGGRAIRVSVAEPPKEREDRTGGAWRREGPLPTLDDNRRTRHSSNNYERSSVDEVDRGERMGFGSKFVPSSASSTNLSRRTQSGRGFSRAEGGPGTPAEGEIVDRGERMGFGSKFVASAEEPRRDRDPPKRGSNFVPSRVTPVGSDDGHSVSGGSGRRVPFSDRKTEIGLTAADSVSSWRSAKSTVPSSTHQRENSSSISPAAPPARRKLELSARTVTSDDILTPPQSVASTKPSPFGAAKPVDSTERDKAIQEKLDRERKKSAPAVGTKNPSPFGGAKPVDSTERDKAIQEKLDQEKQKSAAAVGTKNSPKKV